MSAPADARGRRRKTRQTESVDGGVLVWENAADAPGRRLVGFAAVENWDKIRSELIRRGIGVGALHQLEEFDYQEVAGQ